MNFRRAAGAIYRGYDVALVSECAENSAVISAQKLSRIPGAMRLFPVLTAPSAAQHVLNAEDAGTRYVVRVASRVNPCGRLEQPVSCST
jgi:hypothetical protein